MGLATLNGQTYYNLFVCDELSEFSIETADKWDPSLCKATSPTWIPFVSAKNPDQEVLSAFTQLVRTDLMEKLEALELKDSLDPTIVTLIEGFDTGLNIAIGYGLRYYAIRFSPGTKMGRLSQRAARGAGWLIIISALLGGGMDVAEQIKTENIYNKKIEALSQVIDDIDQGLYFNEDSPSSQVINILEIIEGAIRRASEAVYYSYCFKEEIA